MEWNTLRKKGKGCFKTRMDNAVKNFSNQSKIKAWRCRRAVWWSTRLIGTRRVEGSLFHKGGAACRKERCVILRLEWWLKESDRDVLWWDRTGNVEKKNLICGGNNFVLNAFLCLQWVLRSKNMVRIGTMMPFARTCCKFKQTFNPYHHGRIARGLGTPTLTTHEIHFPVCYIHSDYLP